MKSPKFVSLCVAVLAISLAGCSGGDKAPEPVPTPTPITLEVKETKRDVTAEIKKLVPGEDTGTNKALIIDGDILLVTYGAKNCITEPTSAKLTDSNTFLVEVPETKPLIACEGDVVPQGWDIDVPEDRAKEIKSAQLTFPSGISGGISIYSESLSPDVPADVKGSQGVEMSKK